MADFIFASSLVDGLLASSTTGWAIVVIQLGLSVAMVAGGMGKYMQVRAQARLFQATVRAILGRTDGILGYQAEVRAADPANPVETIYFAVCSRLRTVMPEGCQRLDSAQMELVRAKCDNALDTEVDKVEYGLGMVSSIVMILPMLGLLGTVWGVLDAFAEMGGKGATSTVSINAIAPAISSALVTTVVGLLTAIPGQVMHRWLSALCGGYSLKLEGFADTLMGTVARDYQGAK